jgi:2-hydroxy-3-oxopropionate reductase
MMHVAFCGLGLMGAPMVRRLLQAGHAVTVWNRSPGKLAPLLQAGARAAPTPAAAAAGARAVLLCVYDAAAVESVVFGTDGLARTPGLRWLADHSSIDPDTTRDFARRLKAQCGADWVDAPVSGGVAGADAGTLAIMAGGALHAVDEAAQCMAAYAGRVTRMGEAGAGQATKLCNQTIVAATVLAIAEAVSFAQRSGIDVARLAEALAGGWADSKPLQVFVPRMLQAQAQSIGALSTMLKDVDTVAGAAQAAGLPMPLTGTVQQVLRIASAMGLGPAELSAVVGVLQPERRDEFMVQVTR